MSDKPLAEQLREQWQKLRGKVQASIDGAEDKPPSKWHTDAFWLYRWIKDWQHKRVGLTIITWEGEEYGYRRDIIRIPKAQLDLLRESTPWPCHRSNSGWNEWVLVQDPEMTPFPVVEMDESGHYPATAVDSYLYLVNKAMEMSLVTKKKNEIPLDGKMLALCAGAIAVCAFIVLGVFS